MNLQLRPFDHKSDFSLGPYVALRWGFMVSVLYYKSTEASSAPGTIDRDWEVKQEIHNW